MEKRCNFDLKSHKRDAPVVNNIKLDPVGYLNEQTTICREPEIGIVSVPKIRSV